SRRSDRDGDEPALPGAGDPAPRAGGVRPAARLFPGETHDMKCHEAKRHLDLFMDGELSVPENLKVLEHLNLCRACGAVYEGEKALRAALRARLGAERAPEGLVERLAQAKESAAPLSVLPRRRWLSIAAAA